MWLEEEAGQRGPQGRGGMAGRAGRIADACRPPSNGGRLVQDERGSTGGVRVITHSDFGVPGASRPACLRLFVGVLTLFWVRVA
jgi:hypothetical protein